MATLLTGGTGFVGQRLIPKLDQPWLTTRSPQKLHQRHPAVGCIEWQSVADPPTLPPDVALDQVVHLMGESIAEGRWTNEKKRRIRDSRVLGTRHLVDALLDQPQLPEVLVSASAIGIYGDPGEAEVTEAHPPGKGFLTDVCQEWEDEALRLASHGVRVVCLRIGIVLGPEGGAIGKMLPLFRWGLGGRLGSGRQWMSWIHLDDLVNMIVWALQHPNVSGPVNATAPTPVRNRDFTRGLAAAVNRPALIPAPGFGLRLALGEFADSLLYSQRVLPQVALEQGFQFGFPTLLEALQDLV